MKQTRFKRDDKTVRSRRQRKANDLLRTMRGKYKHLDLMKGLTEGRREERRMLVSDWQKESLDERQRRLIK